MGRKKQPRNGFYYFMMEFRERQGKQYQNMKDLAEAADPFWKRMNAQQRQPYEQKAKAERNGVKLVKYTTKGLDVEVLKRKENELAMKEQHMKEDTENRIRFALETGNLLYQEFMFIHFNHFCFYTADKLYVPAEVGIAKFNLKHGVLPDGIYHAIMKPGALRMGYASQAKTISNESHQLEPPNTIDNDEYNLDEIMDQVTKYIMGPDFDGENIPPVYAKDKNREIVENILERYITLPNSLSFKVYSMEYFFYILRNVCAEQIGNTVAFHSVSLSTLELEKDVYDFCGEIACAYHKLSDAPNHCSKSHVIRCVYVICDHCCKDVDVVLIPGQHVPTKALVNDSRPNSQMSVSSQPSSSTTRVQAINQPGNSNQRNLDGYLSYDESESIESASVAHSLDSRNTFGGDSEYNQSDSGEWSAVRSRHRGGMNVAGSLALMNAASSFEYPSGGSSRINDNVPNRGNTDRHPNNAGSGEAWNMYQSGYASSNLSSISRGRGRGYTLKSNRRP